MDFIAHRHRARRGKVADDLRPKDMVDWRSSFSSIAHYHVKGRSELAQNPTDAGIIIPTACWYCREKVGIPAGAHFCNLAHTVEGEDGIQLTLAVLTVDL